MSKIFFLLLFRVSASVFSVLIRVNPWQILLLGLLLLSVAMLLLGLLLPSVAFSSASASFRG